MQESSNCFGFDSAFVTQNTTSLDEKAPSTYKEAMRMPDAPEWKKTLKLEFKSVQNLYSWELVQLPSDRKFNSTKWVFDIKRDGREKIVQHKARLVARGFSQIPGADFTEVCSPVSRYTTLRLIFAISVLFRWKRRLLYVNNSSFNAPLNEEIYTAQLKGYAEIGCEKYV